MDVNEKCREMPRLPGVYLMKNRQGNIIYVGKAKNLRARVGSYFSVPGDSRYMVRFLIPRVQEIDFIVTDTEKEALILENTLIKKYRPRYNVMLRDDKTYFSLRLDTNHPFPRLSFVRKVKKDGARYFGPYSSAAAARETHRLIHKLFPLRLCGDKMFKNRRRPCIYCQIRRCTSPCIGKITQEEYAAVVNQALMFLEGHTGELLDELETRMRREAEAMRFEEAAFLRDRINAVRRTVEKQKVVSHKLEDMDIFALHREGYFVVVVLLCIRGGKLIDSRSFDFQGVAQEDEELLSSLLRQYYGADLFIPPEVLLPLPLEEGEALQELLSEWRGKRVVLRTPRQGDKKKLLEMAAKNAKEVFRLRENQEEITSEALEELRHKLQLQRRPERLECFDISNLMGGLAVGSMAVLQDGKPAPKEYRHYRIKSVEGMDDFGMMREVLVRRLTHKPERPPLPDLMILDGGKGQLNVALDVLNQMGLKGIDAVGIAKARPGQAGKGEDRFFIPGRKNPVRFARNSRGLHLLQRIRDEAHRFALDYHHKLRHKARLRSLLDEIPGVGPTRRKALLKHLGSLQRIQDATENELTAVPGMNRQVARNIVSFFQDRMGKPANS